MKENRNVLFLDTENSPKISAHWGMYNQNINQSDLIHDWFFFSVQWAWGDGKTHAVSLLDDAKRYKKNYRDDYHVVKTAHELLDSCDIVVGHNVKKHDLKNLKAKFVEHRLPPIKPIQIVDTLTWAREFGFTSRRLGELCKKLDLTLKLDHEKGLFLKAALGDADALKAIVKYGKGDIPTLRELYYTLRPHASKHPNMNLFIKGRQACPVCRSDNIIAKGFRYTASGKYQAYYCKDCGKKFQDGKRIQGSNFR